MIAFQVMVGHGTNQCLLLPAAPQAPRLTGYRVHEVKTE